MWHEARKQEKKIRGMMVDYKRRAERRREYYEKIKQDPAQFLQVHGRPAKIHLDPAVAIAADSPATMMPWQGQSENMIDRFDVRAHLDIIPDYKITEPPKLSGDELIEDRKACYERYRTLVQNDFLGVNEDKFLYQIFLEERYGPVLKPGYEDEKKKFSSAKAAIGYVYEDSSFEPFSAESSLSKNENNDEEEENEDEKEEDLSDIDLDVTVDVSQLIPSQCAEMNVQSVKYGMVDDDFITYLMNDKDEAEQLKLAREIEEEKAMFSGRKSRRERRALREKKLAGRKITSPPSYAAKDSPTFTPIRHSTSKSRSRSRSPPNAGKVMFITSFGGEGSDGELGLKGGEKALSNSSKQEKSSKLKDSMGTVIGPQLPAKNGDDSKSISKSGRTRSSSLSSSSSSSRERRTKKGSGDRYQHRKHYKSRRSRQSRSRSSSSSSSSRGNRSRIKRSRRSSSRSSRRSRSNSYSRSKSRTYTCSSQTKTRSRSRSKSKAKQSHEKSTSPSLPPPPVKSYYRHSLSRSNSERSDDSEDDKSTKSSQNSNISCTSKSLPLLGKASPATKSRITPQERLKRKMQLALKKQYKADKKAQMEKNEKQLQEKQDREEELREMAIKLRQRSQLPPKALAGNQNCSFTDLSTLWTAPGHLSRERERRHRNCGYGADSDSDSAWARTPEHSSYTSKSHSTRKTMHNGSGSSSSSGSSSAERSPKPSTLTTRYRSRSKSPLLPTPSRKYLLEKPRTSPHRTSRRSPSRHSPRSPPRKYHRSPDRGSYNRSSRRVSPSRNSRSPSRRHSSSSRHNSSRQSNNSPTRSRPSVTKAKPLVDY